MGCSSLFDWLMTSSLCLLALEVASVLQPRSVAMVAGLRAEPCVVAAVSLL